jgi:PAS domain-containing protein
MHYIGMAALQAPADFHWLPSYVLASIILSVALSAAAMMLAQRRGVAATLAAGVTLSLALIALHFTGMSALTIIPNSARSINSFPLDTAVLALAVSALAFAALGVAFIAALYDRRLAIRLAHFDQAREAIARQSEEQLRERNGQLDAALNNMSQALCMFDGAWNLIVCNARYAEVFDLPLSLTKPGTPIFDILKWRVSRGMYPGDDGEAYLRSRLEIAGRNVPSKSLVELRDGRILSVLHEPMIGGGWVATHEDVTQQVRAERALNDAQTFLVEATEKAERAASEARAAHQRLLDASNLMAALRPFRRRRSARAVEPALCGAFWRRPRRRCRRDAVRGRDQSRASSWKPLWGPRSARRMAGGAPRASSVGGEHRGDATQRRALDSC